MAVGVRARVAALERMVGGVGGDEYCHCPGSIGLVWASGEPVRGFVTGELLPVKPDVCPRCGRRVHVVILEWDDGGGG